MEAEIERREGERMEVEVCRYREEGERVGILHLREDGCEVLYLCETVSFLLHSSSVVSPMLSPSFSLLSAVVFFLSESSSSCAHHLSDRKRGKMFLSLNLAMETEFEREKGRESRPQNLKFRF